MMLDGWFNYSYENLPSSVSVCEAVGVHVVHETTEGREVLGRGHDEIMGI